MLFVAGAIMVPHPPLIVHEVGQGREAAIQKTITSFRKATDFIAKLEPETIIITTPHTVLYSDYFHISPGSGAQGSFATWGAPQVKVSCDYDEELVKEIERRCAAKKIPAGTRGEMDASLDHATMIPLYFLPKDMKPYKVVRVGLSGQNLRMHYELGKTIAESAAALGRKICVIASGDLSHKLSFSGPYGYSADGPKYDEKIMQVMGSGDFLQLFAFGGTFLESAAECGHRSFVIMAGILDRLGVRSTALSHEGPFGVGYGVCTYEITGEDASRNFGEQAGPFLKKLRDERMAKEDSYVKLARYTIEKFVRTLGSVPRLPEDLPKEMLNTRAGVFVSLKKNGVLRGCIGTIGPMYANIADEIRHNAVSACSRDPRFTPVMPQELDELEYSVDVLSPMEKISSPRELDVKRYGVLVTKGSRSGILLPDLEGVDTVEQQIDIARQKAGIRPEEDGVELQRFEVIRHH